MKTNKEITYKGYTVPAGTRVTPMHRTGSAAEGPQKYWVDEFAWTEKATGYKDSILKHDAVHYGIVVEAADVEIPQEERRYRCVGFGEIGPANLLGFVSHTGQKDWRDLEVNEQATGTAQLCGNGAGKPERIIRTA